MTRMPVRMVARCWLCQRETPLEEQTEETEEHPGGLCEPCAFHRLDQFAELTHSERTFLRGLLSPGGTLTGAAKFAGIDKGHAHHLIHGRHERFRRAFQFALEQAGFDIWTLIGRLKREGEAERKIFNPGTGRMETQPDWNVQHSVTKFVTQLKELDPPRRPVEHGPQVAVQIVTNLGEPAQAKAGPRTIVVDVPVKEVE